MGPCCGRRRREGNGLESYRHRIVLFVHLNMHGHRMVLELGGGSAEPLRPAGTSALLPSGVCGAAAAPQLPPLPPQLMPRLVSCRSMLLNSSLQGAGRRGERGRSESVSGHRAGMANARQGAAGIGGQVAT